MSDTVQILDKETITNPNGNSQLFIASNGTAVRKVKIDASLQLSPHRSMMNFIGAIQSEARYRKIVIVTHGTSMSYNDSDAIPMAVCALQNKFGKSRSKYQFAASQASTPINGWNTQYSSNPEKIRLRGNSSEDAEPIKIEVYNYPRFRVYYSKELDGGEIVVSYRTKDGDTGNLDSIDCEDQQSYHNYVEYELDASKVYEITMTPPASSYGYLEGFVWDANDFGIFHINYSYGGSCIGMIAGTTNREAGEGMDASSFTSSASAGLDSAFAPNDGDLTPDLIFIDSVTNDRNDTEYLNNLDYAIEAAIDNGSSVIYYHDPINNQVTGDAKTTWIGIENHVRSLASSTYKDNLWVYSADRLSEDTYTFNGSWHSEEDGVHLLASANKQIAADLSWKLLSGIENFEQKNLISNRIDTPALAVSFSQAVEPIDCPIGSVFEDTNEEDFIKELVYRFPNGRGKWRSLTHLGANTLFKLDGSAAESPDTASSNTFGGSCISHEDESVYSITRPTAESVYTLSLYAQETTSVGAVLIYALEITDGSETAILNPYEERFVLKASPHDNTGFAYLGNRGSVNVFINTFTAPTDAYLTSLGLNTESLTTQLRLKASSSTANVWGKIEKGASATI